MSKKLTLEQIQEKYKNFAFNNKHDKGITFFKKIIKNKKLARIDRIQLDLAFLLYHQAFKFYNKKETTRIKQKSAEKQINEAIKILNKIVYSKRKNIGEKDMLNARIYLAQIYAVTKNKKAIELAKETFKKEPSSTTANRLANVYIILENVKLAEFWYKKYEKLSNKENSPKYHTFLDMAVFYRRIGKDKLAEKYLKKILKILPKNNTEKSILNTIKNNFNL